MPSALDSEFSPSEWNVRFSSGAEVLHHHYALVRAESDMVRDRLLCESMAYGTAAAERLDMFSAVDSRDTQPILVFVHGGYWQAGSRPESAYVAKQLCRRTGGYKVCVLGYDLCPGVPVEGIVEQIVRAARFIGDYAERTGSKHINYMGHSAGAHLIVCALQRMMANMPQCVQSIRHLFLVSGVYDLQQLRHTQAVNPGNILGLHDGNVHGLSPLPNASQLSGCAALDLRIHVLVAEHDSQTFRRHSRDYADALLDVGVKCDFAMIVGCDHFDVVERLVEADFQLTKDILATV